MDDPLIVTLVTAGLITASAFFVAIEFALIAARRNRLEDAAAHSFAARAALRSATELSVLLAGAQLGITVCTLALGAITKPAVHHWITPGLETIGAPAGLADAGGFVLALIVVTFLHLVIGEMAPKSWAIAHPEKSAILLAVPMRVFMWFTRPLIVALNKLANRCLRVVGVEPVDELAAGQDPDALRHLVEHSATTGALDSDDHRRLAGALELENRTVGDMVDEGAALSSVPADAGPAGIRERARAAGHLRLLVTEGGRITGVVHARDTLCAAADATARDLMRPVPVLTAQTPAYQVLQTLQDSRNHLALVYRDERLLGVITLTDILERLMPTRTV